MLQYAQIREWAASHFHEDPDDSVLATLYLRWTNDAVGEIASAHRWQWLEGLRAITFGSDGVGSGNQDTGLGVTYLPHHVQDLLSVWAAGQGYRKPIAIIGAWELDALSPSVTTGTLSDYLVVWGYYNVENDITTAGTVTATASGGASAENATVFLEGINNTTGLEHRETLTLGAAGTATSSTSWAAGADGLRRVYVGDSSIGGTGEPTNAQVGTVTVADAASVTIERINCTIGERIHEHLRTEISPAPGSAGQSYVVRYYKRIRPVLNTTDIVELPQEFESALFLGLGRRIAEFQGKMDEAMVYDTQFRKKIYDLKRQQGRTPGRLRGLRQLSRSYLRAI